MSERTERVEYAVASRPAGTSEPWSFGVRRFADEAQATLQLADGLAFEVQRDGGPRWEYRLERLTIVTVIHREVVK